MGLAHLAEDAGAWPGLAAEVPASSARWASPIPSDQRTAGTAGTADSGRRRTPQTGAVWVHLLAAARCGPTQAPAGAPTPSERMHSAQASVERLRRHLEDRPRSGH